LAGNAVTLLSGLTGNASSGTTNVVSLVLGGDATVTQSGTTTLALAPATANTYTGATTVNAGILSISHPSALGTTAAGTTVADGSTLQLQSPGAVGNEALTLSGAGAGGIGALDSASGAGNSWSGAVTLAANSTVAVDAGGLNLSGAVGQSTAGLGLTKIG